MFNKRLVVGVVALALALLTNTTTRAQTPEFKDVPANHWAADAVKELASLGILTGFPDGTFRGDQPVTRYELAVTLARFMRHLEESLKDLKARTPKASLAVPLPTRHWAYNDLEFLAKRGYLAEGSPLLRDLSKPVDPSTLSIVLSQAIIGLVERYTLSPEDLEIPQPGPPYRLE